MVLYGATVEETAKHVVGRQKGTQKNQAMCSASKQQIVSVLRTYIDNVKEEEAVWRIPATLEVDFLNQTG